MAGHTPPEKRLRRTIGAQPGNSNALKSGRFRRRRLLAALDWRTQLDRRSALFLELQSAYERLAAGVGGLEVLSPQKLSLLPTCAQLWLELDTLNHYIAKNGNLIDRRKKTLRPIVHDRNKQAMTLKVLLEVIGFDRSPKPVESLASYMHRAPAAENPAEAPSLEPETSLVPNRIK